MNKKRPPSSPPTISRRTFLKGSAAAIAAALAASTGKKFLTHGVFGPTVIHAQAKEVVLAVQEFAQPAIKSVLPDFEKSTGFTVKFDSVPANGLDAMTKYSTAFATNQSPVDILSNSDETSPAFMKAGWLLPLDDVLPKATWNDFPVSMKSHMDSDFLSMGGKHYRLQHEFAVGYFFTRKDLLDAKNLKAPTTWDEMVAVGKQVTDASKGFYATTDALVRPGLMYVFIAYLAVQAGGDVFKFDDATASALQFLYDMIYTHKIFPEAALDQDYTAQNNLYTSDKIAFMREWPFFQDIGAGIKDWYKPEKMVIELPPAGKAGPKSWVGGWGWSIPKSAPNLEGAKQLLTYITSVDVAPRLAAQQSHLLTPRASILKALSGQNNAIITAMQKYSDANVFAPRPFHPRIAQAQTVVDDIAALFLTKQVSLSDALKQAKDRMAVLAQASS